MATTVKKITTPYDAALANAKASLFTPEQLRNIASQQAGAQITSAVGGINAISEAEQKSYTNLAERAAGLAQALGSFGEGYGQQAFDAYNKGAETIGQLGTGLTGAAGEAWRAEQAQNQQTIQQTLGPGLGKVESYDPGALQSSLHYQGVTMPGTSLAQQALTARDMAQYGAMADKAHVASISRDWIAKAAEALDKRAAERAAIVAKRPELFQAALQAQREDQRATQTQLNSLIEASTTWLQNKQKLAMTKKQQAEQLKLAKSADARAQEKARQDEWLREVAITHVDPNTGEPVGGWTWANPQHTVVAPWQSKIAAQQTNKQIAQKGRALTLQEKAQADLNARYTRQFNLQERALNLKKSAADAPSGFDKDMSAAVGYISDELGRPIVTRNGKPIPYKTPAKPGAKPKPMSVEDKLKIQGTMSDYAQMLKAGAEDPETGATIQKAVDIKEAVGLFASRGYLQGKLAPWAVTALAQAYGLSANQVIGVANGINPATGVAYNVSHERDVRTPEGWEERDLQVGKPWVESDAILMMTDNNRAMTKSGRFINVKTRRYVK